MKKISHSLFILWCVLFVLFIGISGYYFYDIQKNDNIIKKISEQNLKDETVLDEIDVLNHNFIFEGEMKKSVKEYAITHYYMLPKFLRESFEQSDWKIVLTDKDIQKVYYEGDVEGRLSGLTNTKEKKIYIHSSRSDIRNAFIHEFGHYFDFITGMTSFSSDFHDIFKAEKEQLNDKWSFDGHAVSNAQEYFAESFAQMLVIPETCKKDIPKTTQYLEKLIDEHKK